MGYKGLRLCPRQLSHLDAVNRINRLTSVPTRLSCRHCVLSLLLSSVACLLTSDEMIHKNEHRKRGEALYDAFGREVLVEMVNSGCLDHRIVGVNSSCSYQTSSRVAKCSAGAGIDLPFCSPKEVTITRKVL